MGGGSGGKTDFDPTIANVARVYDYLLGGKNNFAADRQLADEFLRNWPTAGLNARQQRAFLVRAVRYCAGRGVDQFLDVGSGLPTMDNVHDIARRIIPGAAVVYVDNDRLALSHAKALLATTPGVAAIWGDARSPREILAEVRNRGLIDFARPMVVLMTGILHFIREAAGIVGVFRDAMPEGSYLVLSQGTLELDPEEGERAEDLWSGTTQLTHRSRREFAELFTGLELLEPGVVLTVQWRPDGQVHGTEGIAIYAGVGYKPHPAG
jgi:S-adenosyl methyltransferase